MFDNLGYGITRKRGLKYGHVMPGIEDQKKLTHVLWGPFGMKKGFLGQWSRFLVALLQLRRAARGVVAVIRIVILVVANVTPLSNMPAT